MEDLSPVAVSGSLKFTFARISEKKFLEIFYFFTMLPDVYLGPYPT